MAGQRHLCGPCDLGCGVARCGREPRGRPTFGGGDRLLEVHLFEREVDLYGRRLCCAFIERLRAEETFATVEDLKAQMDQTAWRPARLLLRPHREPRYLRNTPCRRAFIDTPMTDSYPFGHELLAPAEANYGPGPAQGSGSWLSPQLQEPARDSST